MSRLIVMLTVLIAFGLGGARSVRANQQITQTPLSGKSIPKYVEPLPTFVGARIAAGTGYAVAMEEFQQMVLPADFYATLPAPFTAGTYVWGYKVGTAPASYPGATVEAQKGTPVTVTYTNDLIGPNGTPPVLQTYLTVDQTVDWADPLGLSCDFFPTNPQCFTPYGYPNWPGIPLPNPMPPGGPVPAAAHLHGAEVQSFFDGGPDTWFTPTGLHGPAYSTFAPVSPNQAQYVYGNSQEATTLWFHDHAFGATRINVYGGLAAFYFLRDIRDTGLATNPIGLPAGNQEIEIVIQDRMFDTNGQWFFPDGPGGLNGTPPNPSVHPFWIPEFFGDVIVVNGKTWPHLVVEPRRYRFRFLDGSNARMYDLALKSMTASGPAIWQIGTDGGLLDSPVQIAWPNRLFMAPGERADVIIDFADFAGQTLTLVNDAKAPFPSGAPADPQTVGQIMQFRVSTQKVRDETCDPVAGTCNLRGTNPIVRLADPATGTLAPGVSPVTRRQLVLKEIEGSGGPLEVLLNNTHYDGILESTLTTTPTALADSFPSSYTTGVLLGDADHRWLTEGPRVGSTEEWDIINTTADAHPIHVHLVQFQLLNRQRFSSKYSSDWEAAFAGGFSPGDGPPFPYNNVNADGAIGGNLPVGPYLLGGTMPPLPNEAGWKDTVVMKPGEVTRIAVRWAPQDTPIASVTAGMNLYSFDPTEGPGYVWHCHILDHEDNEMMRPYAVLP
jgi:spore coat protein A, manganese oxidase